MGDNGKKKFKITEKLSRIIEADSKSDARRKYRDEEVVLDWSDHTGTIIEEVEDSNKQKLDNEV